MASPHADSAVTIGGVSVPPGGRARLELPVSRLLTESWLSIPVEVVNGRRDGPRLWLSAAVHGDELNGVEIIRRVLQKLDPPSLRGAVLAVPIVNVFGFIEQSRYLPDRRDLNRSFPGSAKGSLAARLAHLFMTEVVNRCSYGVDLHTGSGERANLPQVRANLKDAETRRCVEAFAAPVMMHSEVRDGSLRQAATKRGIHVLLYEAGEARRFNEQAVSLGVAGILRLLDALNMRPHHGKRRPKSVELSESTWVRARHSGIVRLQVELGEQVERRQPLGVISDAYGEDRSTIKAPEAGIVIGCSRNPLVNAGEAVVHLGKVK